MAGRSYLWCWPSLKTDNKKWVTQDQATLVTQHGRLVKTLLGGDNLIEVNNLAADPLIKPAQIVDGATWTRTMGWTEYQQVRYATARSVFKWDGTDTVKVGSDETPGSRAGRRSLHRPGALA